jgi:hypothetical protein
LDGSLGFDLIELGEVLVQHDPFLSDDLSISVMTFRFFFVAARN